MEYALEDTMPLYAGGLGVLAGDLLRQAAQERLPWLALGLFYQHGFSTSDRRAGAATPINPRVAGFELLTQQGTPVLIPIEIYNRSIYAQVWHKQYGSASLYLLDTNTLHNASEDRLITEFLYDEHFEKRLLQEVVIGVGSIKLLRHLGITPCIYHLNEGHTSFAILALALEYLHDHPNAQSFNEALRAVREQIVATKHTILPGAGIYFTKEQFKRVISCYFTRHHASFEEFFEAGRVDNPIAFSTTKFLMAGSVRASAVSTLHAFFEKEKHPHSQLIPITNGIFEDRWQSSELKKLNLSRLTDAELWQIHSRLRGDLIQYVYEKTGAQLDPQALTIVWGRRFAGYKRPELLFSDIKKLNTITHLAATPVQIIIAGQAHPGDREGNELIQRIIAYAHGKEFRGRIVYLPEYSLGVARVLTGGADVWLNTPERGQEACGTSGMKSGLNGGLQFSISDGWVGEVDWTDMGWVLPETETTKQLYSIIENKILPAFFTRDTNNVPLSWVKRMRLTMELIRKNYTLARMLKEYCAKLYIIGRL